jgi:outer membrane biogenesis lipoprotein LolB
LRADAHRTQELIMKPTRYVPLSAALAMALLLGCEKSAEQQQREAEKAAAEAEQKSTKAAQEANQKSTEAQQKAAKETQDFLASAQREQADYRSKISDELRHVDKRLADLKVDLAAKDGGITYDKNAKNAQEIERLLARRETLMKDMDVVNRTQPRDWPSIKTKIDQDLREDGARHPRTGT